MTIRKKSSALCSSIRLSSRRWAACMARNQYVSLSESVRMAEYGFIRLVAVFCQLSARGMSLWRWHGGLYHWLAGFLWHVGHGYDVACVFSLGNGLWQRGQLHGFLRSDYDTSLNGLLDVRYWEYNNACLCNQLNWVTNTERTTDLKFFEMKSYWL